MNFMPFFSRDYLEWNTKPNMWLHLTWLLTARPYFEYLIYKLCISKVVLLSWKMWCHMLKFTELQPHHNYCNLIVNGFFAARFKVVPLALHITITLAVWIPCWKRLPSGRNPLVRHSSPYAISCPWIFYECKLKHPYSCPPDITSVTT